MELLIHSQGNEMNPLLLAWFKANFNINSAVKHKNLIVYTEFLSTINQYPTLNDASVSLLT